MKRRKKTKNKSDRDGVHHALGGDNLGLIEVHGISELGRRSCSGGGRGQEGRGLALASLARQHAYLFLGERLAPHVVGALGLRVGEQGEELRGLVPPRGALHLPGLHLLILVLEGKQQRKGKNEASAGERGVRLLLASAAFGWGARPLHAELPRQHRRKVRTN